MTQQFAANLADELRQVARDLEARAGDGPVGEIKRDRADTLRSAATLAEHYARRGRIDPDFAALLF
jgi:hypothetical protein